MKLIEVTIGPQGETNIETRGFAGTNCREASRYLESALGRSTTEQLTSEFFLSIETQQTNRHRN